MFLIRSRKWSRVYGWNLPAFWRRVWFCDGSFYDDSLLQPLSSRTEQSRLVEHHCRNSRVLSLLNALLALFRCACISSFSILVQFFEVDGDFSTHESIKKTEKNQNSSRYILSSCLLNHGLGLLQQNKKWFDWYFFFNYLCNFLYT